MYLKKIYISYVFVFLSGISHLNAQSLNNRIDSLIKLMSTQDKINQLINNTFFTTADNTSLGIPGFKMCDGPHGIRCRTATSFPVGMAMAATWDISMIEKVGKAMGEEFWAYGYNQQLGPCIDLCRDPRAGRSAESGGEDPFLSGQIGAAAAKGIQTTPVIATVKHFMVESKQPTRHISNQIYTERWMMEHYGYNFRTAMQEGACFSIMNAYNLINDSHCTENAVLLDTVLRKRWGFPFYIVSDWNAIHNSKNSIIAGTDVCMGSNLYKNDLPSLIANGQVSIEVLNKAVANVLRTKILSGMMDYYPKGNASLANSAEHVQVALETSRKSIILLKNENKILPLNKSTITKIAVIGPNADVGNLNCYGSSEMFPPFSITIKQGITKKVGSSKLVFAKGCAINSADTSGFEAAKKIAAQADYIVFVGGLDSTQEGEGYNTGNDRQGNKVELPEIQQELINELAIVNKNLIVVLHSGGVCAVNSCINHIKGFIYSFYPGQEAGEAIADVLFGDYNPGGRMPVSMPKSTSQLPMWDDDFTNDYGCGYRWFDQNAITPEFAFGTGMSYTTFEYSNLHISSASAPAGSPIQVSIDVKNTGAVAGDEVVQLYLTNNHATLWMPKKELKGFKRITLNAGEKQTVTFTLGSEEFYFWSETNKRYEVSPNAYVIRVGSSSDNLPLTDTLKLTASKGKPDLKITQIFTMPRYPLKGQKVTFYALVKNQGNAAVTQNDKFKLSFTIDNTEVAATNNVSATIQPGQALLIESTSSNWNAPSIGNFLIGATVDKSNTIDEWIESNNTFSRSFEVYNPIR